MHVLFIDIWNTGSGYNSNPTVFILAGIGILPQTSCFIYLFLEDSIRGIIPCMANPTVFILGGIGILQKFMFYLLIYRGGDQIINPILQY
jgi:hypothetical protein